MQTNLKITLLGIVNDGSVSVELGHQVVDGEMPNGRLVVTLLSIHHECHESVPRTLAQFLQPLQHPFYLLVLTFSVLGHGRQAFNHLNKRTGKEQNKWIQNDQKIYYPSLPIQWYTPVTIHS